MNADELEEKWVDLKISGVPLGTDLKVQNTGYNSKTGPLLVATNSSKNRCFLVPLGGGEVLTEDTRGSGLHVLKRELADKKAGSQTYALIQCNFNHMHRAFSSFCAEIVKKVSIEGVLPGSAIPVLLDEWRYLFSAGREEMGEEKIIGLYGEMKMLQFLSDIFSNPVSLWCGPGGVHDFLTEVADIEVKTTQRRKGRFVQIHGVEQLEKRPDKDLFLSVLQLEKNPRGQSLHELIEELTTVVKPLDAFFEKLQKINYFHGKDMPGAHERYGIIENVFYAVNSEFPKVTRGEFKINRPHDRVTDLSYLIDLTGQPPVPLSLDQFREIFKK